MTYTLLTCETCGEKIATKRPAVMLKAGCCKCGGKLSERKG